MIEYTNGQFGAIANAKDVLEMLRKMPSLDEVRAVHIGSVSELSKIRSEKVDLQTISEKVAELEKELRSLRPTGMVKVFQMEDVPCTF